jgi:hypothetical protein
MIFLATTRALRYTGSERSSRERYVVQATGILYFEQSCQRRNFTTSIRSHRWEDAAELRDNGFRNGNISRVPLCLELALVGIGEE